MTKPTKWHVRTAKTQITMRLKYWDNVPKYSDRHVCLNSVDLSQTGCSVVCTVYNPVFGPVPRRILIAIGGLNHGLLYRP